MRAWKWKSNFTIFGTLSALYAMPKCTNNAMSRPMKYSLFFNGSCSFTKNPGHYLKNSTRYRNVILARILSLLCIPSPFRIIYYLTFLPESSSTIGSSLLTPSISGSTTPSSRGIPNQNASQIANYEETCRRGTKKKFKV